MKKYLLIGLLLLVLSGGIFAQEDLPPKLVFEPDALFTVQDLGFTFLYPGDWAYDTSDGIQFAANESDLALILDEDDATHAVGYQMNLVAYPVEAFELEEGSDVNDLADRVIELAEVTVYERFEQPVMSYRGIVFTGIDEKGEEGIAIVWQQNEYMVMFLLGLPSKLELSKHDMYTFGFMLGTMTPITDVVLTETAEVQWQNGFTMDYPEGWFTGGGGSDGYFLVEFETDSVDSGSVMDIPKGKTIHFQALLLEDLGLAADSTAWDVVELLMNLDFYAEMTHINEHVLFGSLAVSMRSTVMATNGEVPVMLVVGVQDDEVFAFSIKAPNDETLAELAPIVLTMLKSIEPMDD